LTSMKKQSAPSSKWMYRGCIGKHIEGMCERERNRWCMMADRCLHGQVNWDLRSAVLLSVKWT
jgi:hypothetical protein